MASYNHTENGLPRNELVSRLLYLPRGISRLEKLGEKKKVAKNHILVQGGSKSSFCYIVKTGRVVAYEYSANGEERIYNFHEQNSLLLEDIVLFDRVSPVSFKTAKESELVFISKQALTEAMNQDPKLAMDLIASLSDKFQSSMEQIRQIHAHNAAWKICNLLLIFAEHYGILYDDKILIQEKISQQTLSSLLGINRITAVRAINELKNMALIEQINGYYCIRDLEKLRKHQERID